jgi:hypothetical protein
MWATTVMSSSGQYLAANVEHFRRFDDGLLEAAAHFRHGSNEEIPERVPMQRRILGLEAVLEQGTNERF